MMSVRLVFLVVLGVSLSMAAIVEENLTYMDKSEKVPVPVHEIPEDAPEAPKRCCTPQQWEGIISGFVGYQQHRFSKPGMVMEVLYMSYDGKNKRIAMNGTIYSNERASHIRIIELFEKKKLYVIDESGKCVSQDLPGEFIPACVPANATYNGRFRIGLGTESIMEDSWMMDYMGYHVFFSVTPKQCIPTSESVFGSGEGRRGVPMLSVMGYVNINTGIKSKTVFTPPKDCPSGFSELGSGMLKYMHGKLGGL